MLIDLTAVDTKKDRPKFERHSQNCLQLIREAGLEQTVNYKAYASSYTLSYQEDFVREYPFKPRGYKKQVQQFLDELLIPSTPEPSPIGTEAEEKADAYLAGDKTKKYSFFEIARDMADVMEKGAEVETDEEMDAVVALMDKQELTLEKKAESFIRYHRHNELQVKMIDEEIARLQAIKKQHQSAVNKDLKLAEKVLEFFGVDKIKCNIGQITTRKSTSLEVTGQVDARFITTIYSLNEKQLRDAINPLEFDMWTEEEKLIHNCILNIASANESYSKKEITDAIKKGEKIDFAYLKENKKGVIK